MLALIGLLLGLILGLIMRVEIPLVWSNYVAIAILAIMDSMFGALSASLRGKYSTPNFLTGLIGNSIVAVLLTILGERLNIQLNIAAVVAFGVRIFSNISEIRRLTISALREKRREIIRMRHERRAEAEAAERAAYVESMIGDRQSEVADQHSDDNEEFDE
ncbi:MAG: small basic family protein [Clostridiaceae bacterium]|nr:small basic family protein [Clostridiaceae bacterium]